MVEFRQKILFLTPDNLRILHGSDSSVNCVSVFRRSVPIFLAKVILNIVPHIYIYIHTQHLAQMPVDKGVAPE